MVAENGNQIPEQAIYFDEAKNSERFEAHGDERQTEEYMNRLWDMYLPEN